MCLFLLNNTGDIFMTLIAEGVDIMTIEETMAFHPQSYPQAVGRFRM